MRLANALGRSAGNPLYVISQKTLTGHAKGGAALFQMAGLTQIFSNGTIPGNKSLDCLDPAFEEDTFLVWPRQPLKVGTVKAAVLTSLGFGHVAALVALVHPGAFEQAVALAHGEDAAHAWREQATARLGAGTRQLAAGMIGHAPLFEEIDGRRFSGDAHEEEAAMLLDPEARLGANGNF